MHHRLDEDAHARLGTPGPEPKPKPKPEPKPKPKPKPKPEPKPEPEPEPEPDAGPEPEPEAEDRRDDGESDRLRRVIAIADRQRGLIDDIQLRRGGLDRHAIRRLVARGWLRPVHRGVYLVGHSAPVAFMAETAAILAYRHDCFISGRSALVLWKVLPPAGATAVEVTVLGRNCRAQDGIRLRRVKRLDARDTGSCERLPVTMPARALLESACELGVHETEKALDEALALGLVDRPALIDVIRRYPRHRGVRILRQLADPNRASEITQSVAARRLGELLRKAEAPPSHSEYPIGRYRADRCWDQLKVVVEVDGVRFHRDRKRMELDNRRQDDIRRRGHAVTRFTGRQVMYAPEYVLFWIGVEIGLAMARNPTTGA